MKISFIFKVVNNPHDHTTDEIKWLLPFFNDFVANGSAVILDKLLLSKPIISIDDNVNNAVINGHLLSAERN